MSEENLRIKDELRCKRTDGKQWRCTAMSMRDKSVCEKHYLQGKRRAANRASRLKRKSFCDESGKYLEEGEDDNEMMAKRKIQSWPRARNSECAVGSQEESSPRHVGMSEEESYRAYKTTSIDEESGANTCHHCRRKDGDSFISCLRCNQIAFCEACVSTWYSEISREEIKKICPACRGLCDCRSCLHSDNTVKVRIQEIPILDKLQYLYRVLSAVLPVIKQIHCEQCAEVEQEKKLRGIEIDLVRTRLKADEQLCCDICRIPIVDYYRHCSACSYDLCLRCCQDIRARDQNPEWKANIDGSIPCPPKETGGCGLQSLNLARVFKMNWVAKLVKNAEEMVSGCKVLDTKGLQEPAHGEARGDSFVYIPSPEMIKSEGNCNLEKQLRDGRVVVVGRVLDDESLFHRWDPEVMWNDIVKISKEEDTLVKAIDFLDGSEIDVSLSEFMKLYRGEGRRRENGLPVLWKLKEWPSPSVSEEFVSRLPLLEYIHPRLGVLNVAAKSPSLYSLQNDSGPKIHVSCGNYQELGQGDSVTYLHCDMRDMVYLLVHTSEGTVDATRERKPAEEEEETGLLLSSEARSRDLKMGSSCRDCGGGGARWDIFRRQDGSKIAEFLKMHRRTLQKLEYSIQDFASCSLYEGHYLNEDHKRQLKEEFGVEPLSFEQRRGEAIFIPAGSPFQVKNLKSNVQLSFDFLFPESVAEAVRLAEEIRCLPNDHEAKHQMLEIGKLSLYAASSAIKEVQKLVLDPKFGAELGFEDPNLTNAVTEKLDNAVKRPQQISCQ